MNRIFLRVMAGTAISLLGYAVFAFLLFNGLNTVRFQQFQEELAEPLVQWLRASPESHLAVLDRLAQSSDARQHSLVEQTFGLTRLEQDRLNSGHILFKPASGLYQVVTRLDNGPLWFVMRWQNPLEDSALWLGQIVALEASVLNEESRRKRLVAWSDFSGYQFRVLSPDLATAEDGLNAFHQARLRNNSYLFQYDEKGLPDRLLLSLADGNTLEMSQLRRFNPWSVGIILALGVAGLVFLAAALYFLLDTLDRRLRKLETMASRIARGELEARVDESRFDALGRLSRVFNQMAEHIERLVGVQREMIHAVSHELRTPVARIRFGVQMIEDCESAEMRAKQISGIDTDIQELNELIDEILTYARLEQGGPILDFQEVNLLDIVNQVVDEQQRVKPEIVLSCEFQGASKQWGKTEAEPRYIHRSLQNLVGNAMRYASSEVVVICNFSEETCRIDVEDDGAGIPESDWEKVFTPFARLDDSRTRSSGGYGLGLSIVRRILYWHGGQAFVSRSELGGAKFSLVWPRQQSHEAV